MPGDSSQTVEAASSHHSIKWWVPLVVSVLATPIALLIGLMSGGAGHGDYFWAKVLFPYTLLCTAVFESIPPPFLLLALVQYPVYGALLAYFTKHGRIVRAAAIMVAVHALMTLACVCFASGDFG